MKMRPFLGFALAGAVLLGCGGGGGSGSLSDGNLGMFVTDDLNTGYDGVWVRLHKIELLNADGPTVTFDSSAGVEVNLRALNVGGIEHFAFFGKNDVADRTYTGVRVTLAKEVVLFPTGQSTGLQRIFAGLNSQGMKVLSHTYAVPKDLGGAELSIVIDFMLQSWVDDGAFIQNAVIGDGSTDGLSDPDRHADVKFEGVVHALTGTAPFQGFKLATEAGTVVAVKTNSSTAISRSDGAPSPTLQNGQRVEVRGVFVPAEDAVVAASVTIEVAIGDDPEVKGAPFDIDRPNGTFKVEIDEAEGFLPVADFVNVVTNEQTLYFSDHGVPISRAEFFDRLGDEHENEVEVEGPFDPGTNTMAAERCKLDDDDEDGDVKAEGTASNLNALAGTFTLTLAEWEGFSGAVGMQISIATNAETEFRAEDDDSGGMTREEFFALLALNLNARVEAKGRFEGAVLVADELKIENDEDEAEGEVTSVNAGAFSFQLKLFDWEGFPGSFGLVIVVQTNLATEFKGPSGEPMTREQFFAELAAGAEVEAEGIFAANLLTATEVEFED